MQSSTEMPTGALPGTLPVRPFADRFYGVVTGDHAESRVAAIVCDTTGAVVLLSLVGPDGACAAALARLFARESLAFQPAEDIVWSAPNGLHRYDGEMRQFHAALAGTRERHYLALSMQADIRYALHHPTPLPEPPTPAEDTLDAETAPQGAVASTAAPPASPHFVFANAGELAPHRRAFLGHLRGLRVIFLPAWADTLWEHGQMEGLIAPAVTLGIAAWQLSADLTQWSQLITDGIHAGWLGHNARQDLPLAA